MKYTEIVTSGKTAAKAALTVFLLCTGIMFVLAWVNDWHWSVYLMLGVHAAALVVMTFHPKIPVRAQSIVLMVCSFLNVFTCSVLEQDLYPSLVVFLGVAILLSIYKNIKILLVYAGLIVLGTLCHIFIIKSIPFETDIDKVYFVVRISVTFLAMMFLLVIIGSIKRNEEDLKQSVEEARKAEHYKSDFLANMSHEIRTPMNAIVGMCELILRENGLSESVRENCFNIQTSGRSLLSIINDILDFSKIESGKMELIPDEFNIASTLNTVINMSEARKGDKKIDIIVKADPNIPRGLVCDEVRLRQVIVNLMTNGVKYTGKGFVTLTVSFSKQEYGINLLVSVADTGIGISEENIEKLFTSFRQVDTKKNRSVEGTGLGLAISKRLITQMGGFIGVKSEYGKGSEFRFVVPMKVSDELPFVTIKDADKIHAVGYFGRSKQENRETRDYRDYREDRDNRHNTLFEEMGEQLGVDFRCCHTDDELRKYTDSARYTHFFVGRDEYINNAEVLDSIAAMENGPKVFVVQDRIDAIELPQNITSLYKPFYVISVASALNNENMVISLNERRGSDIRFSAPKARVLIVDDNAINLKVAAGLMQPYHMQIITAESGPAAINMLRSKDIDIVFMDHMMPEMDGVEATKIIRAMDGEYYRKLPIIALTANAVNGVREMFIRQGLNDFLAKPIELTALDRTLRTYLPKEYIEAPSQSDYVRAENRKKGSRSEASVMFDPDKGLMYTGGNMEAYCEILDIYAKKGVEKRQYIDELFDKKDWKNYIIEVHALKSTSMSIGAVKLSELAKELELAGKSENYAVIEKKNETLSNLYGEVIDIVNQYLGHDTDIEENANSDNTGDDGGEIEFEEITAEKLREFIERAKEACAGFDSEALMAIANVALNCSYRGKPLEEYFGKAAKLAEDFEYDAAAEKIAELEAEAAKEADVEVEV